MATGFPTYTYEIELTAGVWTDITGYVVGDSPEITIGKDSPSGDIQPGVLDLVLDNSDGTWTPDNPLSAYYPNVVEGKRIRVVLNKGTPAGYSTGSYGTGPYAGVLTQSARFVGQISLLEPDFPDDPTRSKTRVQAVDALGMLARDPMPMALLAPIYSDYAASGEIGQPFQDFYYWPLRGGFRYIDAITGAGSLALWQPTTGGELKWDSDSSFPLGGEPCASFTPGIGLRFNIGIRQGPLYSGIGVAVRLEAGPAGMFIAATDKQTTASDVSGWSMWWDGVGAISYREYVAGTPTTLASVAAAPGWHVVSFDSTQLVVDGVQTSVTTTLSSTPGEIVTLGGVLSMSARDLFITQDVVTPHSYLVSLGQSLSTVTQNVARQAGIDGTNASLGWSSAVTDVLAVPPVTEGRTAIEVISDLANSQSGLAYVAYSLTDPQPIILVANRDNRDTAVDLTLDAAGDLHGGPTLDRNVYNKVASATAKSSLDSVTVSDSTLIGTYGASTAERQTVLAEQNKLAAVASDLISQSKSSKLRLSQVTFDLVTAQNDLYSDWFGLAPGERVRVAGLWSTYFGVTQMDGYVLGWKERPRIDGYEVTLNLQPADAPASAKYDDTTYGRFAWGDGKATVTGGTAVGSTSNGTLIITTPTGPCLTTSAGAYPLQLDWNGECVTITAAPASSTSPQTVTITARGVNGTVARSHSAGEAVEIWRAARFAL